MLIKKSESVQKSNGESCKVWEYEFGSDDIGIAMAIINWRYPEKWVAMNTQCDQVYYVVSWSWTILSEQKWSFEVKAWDSYRYEKNEKYYVIWDNLEVILINSPVWGPEQYVLSE